LYVGLFELEIENDKENGRSLVFFKKMSVVTSPKAVAKIKSQKKLSLNFFFWLSRRVI